MPIAPIRLPNTGDRDVLRQHFSSNNPTGAGQHPPTPEEYFSGRGQDLAQNLVQAEIVRQWGLPPRVKRILGLASKVGTFVTTAIATADYLEITVHAPSSPPTP